MSDDYWGGSYFGDSYWGDSYWAEYSPSMGGDSRFYYYNIQPPKKSNKELLLKIKSLLEAIRGN